MVPSTSRYRADISFSILHYFLISTSNESKLIYLFINETPEGEIKTQLCIEDTALPINYRGREATLCSLSTVGVDNLSFQSFLKKFFTPCQLLELSFKKCYQFPFVLLLLWVTYSLLKTPGLKPFRTTVVKLKFLSLWNLFWQGNLGTFIRFMEDHWNCQIAL